jgi:hypothetical protein
MFKSIVVTATLSIGAVAPSHAQSTARPIDMSAAASAAKETRQDKEVAAVLNLWPGNFDNREQVQTNADMSRPSSAHVRIHSAIRRVEVPELGQHILYVEDYRDNDPTALLHHRLYVLAADDLAKGVRITQFRFVNSPDYRGAINDLGRLSALTRADVLEQRGCDIVLRRDGDEFTGGTYPMTCRTDNGLGIDSQIWLSADSVRLRERTINIKSGRSVKEMAGFAWHQLERARFFSCMIDPPRSMVGPARDKPGEHGYVVRIHDQGGTFTFTHADGRTLFMSLRTTWSYNMNRKTLVVTLQENNENGAGLGYAWTEPGADRLGMNPLWIHIQCDLDTPDNIDMQRRMRNVL